MSVASLAASELRLLAVTQADSSRSSMAKHICRRIAQTLEEYSGLTFIINDFSRRARAHQYRDSTSLCAEYGDTNERIRGVRIRGFRARLWRRLLTAEFVAPFHYVWLLDGDMDFSPATFHLQHILHVLGSTRAPLLQPVVLPSAPGGRTTDHQELRIKPEYMSQQCLVRTTMMVEVQTPFWRADVWTRYHKEVLSNLSDRALIVCDFVDGVWCSFVEFATGQQCLLTQGAHVVHEDSWGSLSADPKGTARSECASAMSELTEKFPQLTKLDGRPKPFWFNASRGHLQPSVAEAQVANRAEAAKLPPRLAWHRPFIGHFDFRRARFYNYRPECVLWSSPNRTSSTHFVPNERLSTHNGERAGQFWQLALLSGLAAMLGYSVAVLLRAR